MRLGELLIENMMIEPKHLQEALFYAQSKSLPLGRALKTLRFITEEDLDRALACQKAIRAGMKPEEAMDLLTDACVYKRTFAEHLKAKNIDVPVDKAQAGFAEPAYKDFAQSKLSFQQLLSEGDKLLSQEKVKEAEEAFLQAHKIIEGMEAPPPSQQTALFTRMGNLCLVTDRFDDAEKLFQTVFSIQAKIFGKESPETSRVMEDLADLSQVRGQKDIAKTRFRTALEILQKQNSFDVMAAGRIYKRIAALSEADPPNLRKRIGDLCTDVGWLSADQVREALHEANKTNKPLGIILRAENYLGSDKVDALLYAQLLIRNKVIPFAIAIEAMQSCAKFGASFRQLCESGRMSAQLESADESYTELVLELDRLLAAESSLGTDHPEVAAIACNIAGLYEKRQDKASSEIYYRRAANILLKAPQADPLQAAVLCERFAARLIDSRNFGEAQPMLLKGLELRQAAGCGETKEGADCLWLLGKLEFEQGNYPAAFGFLRSANALYAKIASDPCVEFLETLAVCSTEMNDVTTAENLLQKLVSLAKETYGPFEPETAGFMRKLADVYASCGRTNEAQSQYFFAMQIYERTPGSEQQAKELADKLGAMR